MKKNKIEILKSGDETLILPINQIQAMKKEYSAVKLPTDAIILLEISSTVHKYCGIFPNVEEAEKTRKFNPEMQMFRITPIENQPMQGMYQPFSDDVGIVGYGYECPNCNHITQFTTCDEGCEECGFSEPYKDPDDWYDEEMSKPVKERVWNNKTNIINDRTRNQTGQSQD